MTILLLVHTLLLKRAIRGRLMNIIELLSDAFNVCNYEPILIIFIAL